MLPSNPSRAFIAANPHLYGGKKENVERVTHDSWGPDDESTPQARVKLTIRLAGQVRGGKNNVGRTRDGRSFPKKEFVAWREDAIRQIKRQLHAQWNPITEPVNVRIDYIAGDRRRRDMPAVLDALWHVMERGGVVADDSLLWVAQSSRSYDKAKPGVTITFL